MNIIDFKFDKESPEEMLEQLYDATFFEYVMNAQKTLSPQVHDLILMTVGPALSLKFYEQSPESAEKLISAYLKVKPEESTTIQKFPDRPTALDHVFKSYFKSYKSDLEAGGFEEALDQSQDFYLKCDELYKTLPASYAFLLINLVDKLK